jgi:tetratricopeptide (TPR) repeat protein
MTRKYALQLLRQGLVNPAEMLKKAIYWHPEVFRLFRKRLDDLLFEDPHRSLALATYAPEFAECVIRTNPEVPAVVLRVQARAALGSAYRAVGDHAKAGEEYDKASGHKEQLPPLEEADLCRRRAYLLLVQRNRKALAMIDQAIKIHRTETDLVDRHALGACLLARAHINKLLFANPGQAIIELAAALNHISLKKDANVFYAAVHNLSVFLVDYGSPEELKKVLEYLQPAFDRLGRYKAKHFAKYKLRWLQALVHARFGQTAKAEMLYREARKGLMELDAPFEAAMTCTDLAALYIVTGRSRLLEALAAETCRMFQKLGANQDALQALIIWRQTAAHGTVTLKSLKQLRKRLAEGVPIRPLSE